ncbi:hypothetical protein F4553_007470 [Allocatelliglobosispora scoriae]|uniref:Peptidase M23 n=1 Tax=Allocatelliglobosispora scoriae TaxID=643052 RepID=A0A841C2B9_9ACTN|nr:hypothetical protein [Allocatelliglobosispora scoriae]MBB5874036.1 hypothetical protein [Allocatelliglobosispora scoriae]
MRREAKADGAFEVGGDHRITPNGLPGPFGRLNLSFRTGRVAVATGLLGCLGFAALGAVPAATAEVAAGKTTVVTSADRAQAGAATRSVDRTGLTKSAAKPQQKAAAQAAPVVKKQVAGLTVKQTANARAIVEAGKEMNLPKKAMVIALSTAMQESNLYNLGSTVIPESQTVPNEGLGSDHDSVGLFQQRSSTGWGPVKKLMQPKFAATQFYKGLVNVPGWQNMPVTYAAQAVQVSAYPYAYAKHEGKATAVVNELLK